MKCEKCGKEIKNLLVDIFNYDGTDSEYEIPYQEQDEDAVVIELTKSWTVQDILYRIARKRSLHSAQSTLHTKTNSAARITPLNKHRSISPAKA